MTQLIAAVLPIIGLVMVIVWAAATRERSRLQGAASSPSPGPRPTWIDDVPEEPPDLRFTNGLTLLAELGDLSVGERQERLGKVLAGEKVAPLSPFYLPDAPEAVCRPSPPQAPSTPSLPTPPRWWQEEFGDRPSATESFCATVVGGPVAAGLYVSDSGDRPADLVIKSASAGEVQQFSIRLYEAFAVDSRPRLAIYRHGEGLLAFLTGSGIANRYDAQAFVCEAPDWQAVELYPKGGPGSAVRGAFVGQTADGSEAFLRLVEHPGDPDDSARVEAFLVELDPFAQTFRRLVLPWPGDRYVPSPDGRFLARGVHRRAVCRPDGPFSEGLLPLIDRHDESVTALNRRTIYGGYVCSAVAWSADVPGRLYFTDERDRLWRVDLPVDGPLAAYAEE